MGVYGTQCNMWLYILVCEGQVRPIATLHLARGFAHRPRAPLGPPLAREVVLHPCASWGQSLSRVGMTNRRNHHVDPLKKRLRNVESKNRATCGRALGSQAPSPRRWAGSFREDRHGILQDGPLRGNTTYFLSPQLTSTRGHMRFNVSPRTLW